MARSPQNLQTSAGHLSPNFFSSSAMRFSNSSILAGAPCRRFQTGIRSRASIMSARIVTPLSPVNVIETADGRIQFSTPASESTRGLLIERNGLALGTLLQKDQVKKLAELFARDVGLTCPIVDQSADRSSAFRRCLAALWSRVRHPRYQGRSARCSGSQTPPDSASNGPG